MRISFWAIICLVTLIVGWSVQALAYRFFVADEVTRADGRLSIYRTSITAELEQFAPLVYVLARDRVVVESARDGDVSRMNPRLRDFSDESGLDAIYFIDPDGVTVASSNYDEPMSFVGENYAFRPYFQQAREGARGQFYAIGATTGLPGYFLSEPVRDEAGNLLGVVVLKISFEDLRQAWVEGGEQVFLANEDGVVILASTPSWAYRTLTELTDEQRANIRQTRQFAGADLTRLDWLPLEDNTARIDGDLRLHLVSDALPNGWVLHYFATDDRAVARSWLVTAILAIIGGGLLMILQIQRNREVRTALKRSEREEAALRITNDKLAQEIAERRQAEAKLRQTQQELQKNSRLAALGELSASVTHELGQPIAAMRNHLAAAEYDAKAPKVLGRLNELVDRMEGITKQLKFFATPAPEPFETFDLAEATRATLALLQHRIHASNVTVETEFPNTPALVFGNRLRIEQVLTNLIRNALDATEDADDQLVCLTIGADGQRSWVEVRDTGHGIGDATLSDLQEPFTTTRASGEGMGLGLAISANIVKDHDGEMTARNRDVTGALFRVDLPAKPQTDGSAP